PAEPEHDDWAEAFRPSMQGWSWVWAWLGLGWGLANVSWISTVGDYLRATPASLDVLSSVTPCAWPLAANP
ncbi:MAG: hypothetical protein ACO391_05920, partial [Pseudomonadales bacterium]